MSGVGKYSVVSTSPLHAAVLGSTSLSNVMSIISMFDVKTWISHFVGQVNVDTVSLIEDNTHPGSDQDH